MRAFKRETLLLFQILDICILGLNVLLTSSGVFVKFNHLCSKRIPQCSGLTVPFMATMPAIALRIPTDFVVYYSR